jgi:hypothetical protein
MLVRLRYYDIWGLLLLEIIGTGLLRMNTKQTCSNSRQIQALGRLFDLAVRAVPDDLVRNLRVVKADSFDWAASSNSDLPSKNIYKYIQNTQNSMMVFSEA